MGIYGVDVFGQARFGRDPSLIRPDFSVDPFTFMPLDYQTLHLTWQKPQSTACTSLQLVRNLWNLPQDETDGAILFSDPVSRPLNYTDTGLGQGFYYYSMFGWDSVNLVWVHCSDLIGLVPLNWNYAYRLYTLLPAAYRDQDVILVDPYNPWPVDNPQPPLQRFTSLLGFELDFIRTELESLTSVNDAQRCSGALLPLMAQQFGLAYEPEIGMQQERELIDNAVHLYKLKGSPRGISEFCSIFTSYPMSVLTHHGYNVLLCLDDSIAETSIGTWQAWPPPSTHFTPPTSAAGLNLTQIPNLLTVSGMTNPLETYPNGLPNLNPPYNNTGMRIMATAVGDRYITTGPIPITDFMSTGYGPGNAAWSVQIWTPTTARQVKLSLWGDNGSGVPVPILAEQQFTETVGHWTTMTINGVINPYPNGYATAPGYYYWVYPVIHIIGAAANEPHYVTLMSLWSCDLEDVGLITPAYDYPRDVKITLGPQSENLLSNPLTMFQYGFDGICAATDPLNPSGGTSCNLTIQYVTVEDPASLFAVNGIGSLQVGAPGPNAYVWLGVAQTWTQPLPTVPAGWWTDPNHNWFAGQAAGPARPWVDPVMGWFSMNGEYFVVPSGFNGNWFAPPPQPPQNCNAIPFTVVPYQQFNFSVYARFVNVTDPSNAKMDLGFRWYYNDGTPPSDTFTSYYLTDSYNVGTGINGTSRYSLPPPDPTGQLAYMASPVPSPTTGAQPVSMMPFVRFPSSEMATYVLNSAMLALGPNVPDSYMDFSLNELDSDYVLGANGASYFYRRRDIRLARLEAEVYRWIPMGATHTETLSAAALLPPLDPTLW